ncbi:MAG: hypothetical protein PHU25_12850 [Deltaproteobacteria bacterium]|nr:hypothetical protein [Deltaproteobacteria bacterium]
MGAARKIPLFALLALLALSTAGADDLSYVSDAELAGEVQSRSADIERTKTRIDDLQAEQDKSAAELAQIRSELERNEQMLISRTRVLYRLSQRGATVRYLLGAPSATVLLQRLHTLRRLVLSGLKAQRLAGMRLSETEAKIADLETERAAAGKILDGLTEAQNELVAEQLRRAAASPGAALHP